MTAPRVLVRTDLGRQELHGGVRRLDARTRQVLILIDGRRDSAELARLLGGGDIEDILLRLSREGYASAVEPEPQAPAGPAAPAAAPMARTPTILGPAPGATAWGEPLGLVSDRMARALIATIGPAGDDMATRLRACSTIAELRELLPATVSILEAVGGREAARGFLHRAGRI
jgi:hypothetical protein